MFMIVPVQFFGPEQKSLAIIVMAVLNFLVGWFNGMGWPPCGRVMTHWFSVTERGTMMSIWNCAHNVGGALVGPMAVYGALWFGSWFYDADASRYFLIGTYVFPAAVAILCSVGGILPDSRYPSVFAGFPLLRNTVTTITKNYMARSRKKCLPRKGDFSSNTYSTTRCFGTLLLPMLLSTCYVTDVSTGLLLS